MITNASEMYNYLMKNHNQPVPDKCPGIDASHYFTTFMFVDNISRDDLIETYPLKHISQVHSVESVGEDGVIKIRKFTCSCTGCMTDTLCQNVSHPDYNWYTYDLKQASGQLHITNQFQPIAKMKPIDDGEQGTKPKRGRPKKSSKAQKRPSSGSVDPKQKHAKVTTDGKAKRKNGTESNNRGKKIRRDSRVSFFREMQDAINACSTFEELESIISVNTNEMQDIELVEGHQFPAKKHDEKGVDPISVLLYPNEGDEDMVPYAVYGDGE